MSNHFSQGLLQILQQQPLHNLMRNVRASIDTYEQDGKTLLTTVVDRIQPNCYVVSPYAGMIDYAKDELIKLPKHQQIPARALLATLSAVLRLGRIERVQTLSNDMLSTNIVNRDFMQLDFSQLLRTAIQRYPQHAVLIRSLNTYQHEQFIQQLQQQGWLSMVSRQVYLISDTPHAMRRRDTQKDQRLLSGSRYVFETPNVASITDFQHAERLYNQLYLEKYSRHNVQFTAIYLQALVKADLLHLRLLRDIVTQQVIGVVGMVEKGGVMTTPILGYDTHYPQKAALYRRLNAYAMRHNVERGTVMHLSSGAPTFKKQRGAEPSLEYSVVYIKHLPWFTRQVWRLLSMISQQYYGKLLIKRQL